MGIFAENVVLSHLLAVGVAAVILGTVAGCGRALLGVLCKGNDDATAELTLSIALGIGVVGAALLLVAASLGPHWYVLWGALAVLGWVSRRQVIRFPRLLYAALSEVLGGMPPGQRRMAVVGLAIIAGALILLAVQPPTDYDSLAYHLQVPRQWLDHGRVFLPADNYHTAYIGANDLLYLPMLALDVASASQIFNALILLLLPLAVFATARVVGGDRVGKMAFWLVFGSPILFITGITPMVDVTLAFVLGAATLAALSAIVEERPGYLVASAALVGVGVAVKYLGLIYALALFPMWTVAMVGMWRRSGVMAMRRLGWGALVGVLAAGPWAIKNGLLLGNPIFPFLSASRVEPWLAPLYPDLMPRGVDPTAFTVLEEIREPFNLKRLLLDPASITTSSNSRDSALFWVLLLAPLALIAPTRRRVAGVLGPSLGYGVILLAYSRYTNLRYLIPAIPGLTIAAAVVLDCLRQRLSRFGRWVLACTVVILMLPSVMALWDLYEQGHPFAVASGQMSQHEFLHDYWETGGLMPAVDWVNANVAPEESVILLFDARGYYFERSVREDINVRNWAYLAPFASDSSCLTALGASYLVVNDWTREYFVRRGMHLSALHWAAFERFERDCVTLRFASHGVRIFAIKQPEARVAF